MESLYDIREGKTIIECSLNPTQVVQTETCYWLYASNNKYDEGERDHKKCGKWMIFAPKDSVDMIWIKIKEAVKEGHLWSSKVSTTNHLKPTYAIMIYTKDYTDLEDVIAVLDVLEKTGIKSPDSIIRYKTDEQTRAGIYSGGTQKASIYSSATIRDLPGSS